MKPIQIKCYCGHTTFCDCGPLVSKQTAVEWLIDQMFKQGYFDGNKPLSITNLDHLQHQAKEMEKEQIKDAHLIGLIRPLEIEATKQAEQYYNETYKK